MSFLHLNVVIKENPHDVGAEIGVQKDDCVIQIHNVKATIHDNVTQYSACGIK